MKGNLYIGAVAAVGTAILAGSVRNILEAGFGAQDLAWLGIAILTVLVGRLSVKLPLPSCRVSFSDAFVFLSVMVFGGDYATLTAALDGFASSSRTKGSWHKRLFNTAGMAISVNLSARVFTRLLPEGGVWGSRFSAEDLLVPVAAMAFAQYVLNTALVSGVVALKEHASLLVIWQDSSPWAGTAYLAGSMAAAIVFLVVRELGVVSAFAILPFPGILYLTYRACLDRLVRAKGGMTP
ncbi:MAG TPA: hypothetical protein VGV60_16790 [Candidatus Polarisedimenticolia bacterium]|jgi:hypothetical protein|nr:hypothetical protein [Candidatus Polarisedimenticolia bacterium]